MHSRRIVRPASQMLWIAPGPSISAIVNSSPGCTHTAGAIFHPFPRSGAAFAPKPSVALPPSPLSPVGFSALIRARKRVR